jgi:YfiH family protein
MVEQCSSDNGVVCVVSTLLSNLGVRHAFSTRIGGVSSGPFASLNLGNPSGSIRDTEANLTENYRRLLAAAEIGGASLCRVHQVHSAAVVVVDDPKVHCGSAEADALVTSHRLACLTMRTADCVPVLLATRDAGTVAAVHAGWRGVVAGVLSAAIRALCAKASVLAEEVYVAIGPHIGGNAFEVGPEVVAEFRAVFGSSVPITRTVGAKAFIDLGAALTLQATAAGIPLAQVDGCDLCTHSRPDLFFSHRRDNGVTGRMAAVVATGGGEGQ